MKTYLTFRQLAPKLGYHGKAGRNAARAFVLRRSIPKKWRDGTWVVAEEDVQASLDGKSFVRFQPQAVAS